MTVFSNEQLVQLYNECNERMFNNELTNNVKVEWSNRMTASAGVFHWKRNRITKEVVSRRIALSTQYHKLNANEVMDTLVHEMIHLKFPENSHDKVFHKEVDRINSHFGMDIKQYASGKQVVNHIYQCVECGQEYKRARRIPKGSTCRCLTEGGKLIKI